MGQIEIHFIYCRRFLDQLESAQEKMLKLQQTESANEFELLFDCFNHQCTKKLVSFKSDAGNKQSYRIYKEIGLICRHLQKLNGSLANLKANKLSAEQIIEYFEQQYLLKKVIRKHITDVKAFLEQ
jgi:hypothetical protein